MAETGQQFAEKQERNEKKKNFKARWKGNKEKKEKLQRKCQICFENESKYRCSKCQKIRYCSLKCHQMHQNSEICNKLKQENKDKEKEKEKSNIDEPISVTGYNVTNEQLSMLSSDSRIRQALTNDYLRQIICKIDQSKKPQLLLESFITKDDNFAHFVDYMLHVIQFHGKNVQNYQTSHQSQTLAFQFLDNNQKIEFLLKQALSK